MIGINWPRVAYLIALCCQAPLVSMAMPQTNSPTTRAEIPLKLKQGDLLVNGRINNSHLLAFKLDTGFGITTISPRVAESLQLQRAGGLTIDGIAGEERAATFRN